MRGPVRKSGRGRPFNGIVIRHCDPRLRSYIVSLKASSMFGRASKANASGNNVLAMGLARQTLEVVAQPYILRSNPAEGAVLASTVVLVEQLATEMHMPGASLRD